MITLKGITWDHDRGYAPLIYTSRSFCRQHPDIRIEWKKRTLQEFGDYPVEKLAQKYDLLLIDHPFIGEAYQKNILLDYNQCFDGEFLAQRAGQELGSTYRCYGYEGQQLAFSVDIAAVVAVSRPDLLMQLGLERPQTFQQVLDFARRLPSGKCIASPLCPTDAWCTFLSLGAALGGPQFITQEGIQSGVAEQAIEMLQQLLVAASPRSLNWNPVQVLNEMSLGSEIVYVPYCFGYVNYAWLDQSHPLQYWDAPFWSGNRTASLLGGVGIAVSSQCRHQTQALEYVRYVTDPAVQQDEYFLAGGQPGQRDAWLDRKNDRLTGGFFSHTLSTIQNAYMRPRFPGWNVFQEQAGSLLNAGLRAGYSAQRMKADISALFQQHFSQNKTGTLG